MHIKPDIASLALAQVRALLDSGLSGFGYIRSVFVCLFIPLLVLDSLFVLLAPTRRLLPSDTDPCHSLLTLRPLSRIKIPYIFASPLITGLPLSHTMPRGLSPAALDFNSFSFLSFSPLTPSLRSIYCRPSSQTHRINTPAQPQRKPGNCGPLSLPLLSVSDFLRIFTTSIRPPVTLRHPTCTSAPSSEIFDRFRHRAVLSRRLIPTTNARLHLAPRPYSSTNLRSRLSWERGSYFPYLQTLTQTSRLRYSISVLVLSEQIHLH